MSWLFLGLVLTSCLTSLTPVLLFGQKAPVGVRHLLRRRGAGNTIPHPRDTPLPIPDIVVVMPTVKRSGSSENYLSRSLMSLRTAIRHAPNNTIRVILVNANVPPEDHIEANRWCSEIPAIFKCHVPGQLEEHEFQRVVREDKRGDTIDYLRWRTTETADAAFGLRIARDLRARTIVWLQDDVVVKPGIFLALPRGTMYACLRDGGRCGAVAYMFRQDFVSSLLHQITLLNHSTPLDWILDGTRNKLNLSGVFRMAQAHHIGIKSSSGKIRTDFRAITNYSGAWKLSGQGESCDKLCAKHKTACDAHGLQLLNDCAFLQNEFYFRCRSCQTISSGIRSHLLPAKHGHNSTCVAGFGNNGARTLAEIGISDGYSDARANCEASEPTLSRICACKPLIG